MHLKRRSVKLLSVLLGLSLLAAACGGDDDDASDNGDDTSQGGDAAAGGDFLDYGTIVGDPLEHIDPALNTTLDGFQLTSAMYDGLTDIEFDEEGIGELKGVVAESWEPNEDATEFVFKIKDGLKFSDGTPVLPSSFQIAWERGVRPGLRR